MRLAHALHATNSSKRSLEESRDRDEKGFYRNSADIVIQNMDLTKWARVRGRRARSQDDSIAAKVSNAYPIDQALPHGNIQMVEVCSNMTARSVTIYLELGVDHVSPP
jgi:hypothetical protein